MKNKLGITTSILVLSVVIMFIILTTATVSGVASINNVNYEEYMSQLERVSNATNEYIIENEKKPIFENTAIAKENLTDDFSAELLKNGDNNNNLYVIDISKLSLNDFKIGKGTITDRDLFLIADKTNNVYYFKGYNYKGTMYYGR